MILARLVHYLVVGRPVGQTCRARKETELCIGIFEVRVLDPFLRVHMEVTVPVVVGKRENVLSVC